MTPSRIRSTPLEIVSFSLKIFTFLIRRDLLSICSRLSDNYKNLSPIPLLFVWMMLNTYEFLLIIPESLDQLFGYFYHLFDQSHFAVSLCSDLAHSCVYTSFFLIVFFRSDRYKENTDR